MGGFVGWWSCANMLTGFAKSFGSLGACRFLPGPGEAGGYTASPKIVRRWFPLKDRGIAVGLYSVGGALGATIAPVLVVTESGRWRSIPASRAVWARMFARPLTDPVWYFFIAAGGAFGGILMNETVARTIATHSYAPCFYAMVALYPVAWLLLRRFARKPWATAAA